MALSGDLLEIPLNGQPTPLATGPEDWDLVLLPLRATTPPAALVAELFRRRPEHVCTGRMPIMRQEIGRMRDMRGTAATMEEVLGALLRLGTWTQIMMRGAHRPLSREGHGLWASPRDLAHAHGGDVAREIFLLRMTAPDGAVKIRIVDGEPLFAADLSFIIF